MKTTLLILSLATGTMAAFAQGKVTLENDAGSLVTLTLPCELADAALADRPLENTGPLPSGVILEIGLYGGTSSSSLTLQATELYNPAGGSGAAAPGLIARDQVVLAGIPGGALAYFRVAIWDSAYAFYPDALAAGSYAGEDNIFAMTPGSSISYPSITSGGNSTWTAVGNDSPFFPVNIPEPPTLALAGFGVATLVIFRGRKRAEKSH